MATCPTRPAPRGRPDPHREGLQPPGIELPQISTDTFDKRLAGFVVPAQS